MGHLDFQVFCTVLKAMGFDGYLSAEVIPVPDSLSAAKTWIEAIGPMIRSSSEVNEKW